MKECSIEGCVRKHYGHGHCKLHYTRWKRWGSPHHLQRPQKLEPGQLCAAPGCTRRVKAKDLCALHYEREYHYAKSAKYKRRYLLTEPIPKGFQKEPCCQACNSIENLEIEHILPVSRGGDNSLGNLTTLCRFCNASKGNRTPIEWIMGLAAGTIGPEVIQLEEAA